MRRLSLLSSLVLSPSLLLLATTVAEARVTKLEITATGPAYAGRAFAVGQYEFVDANVTGELDPSDPLNASIVDIDKAPRNTSGLVVYNSNIRLLRPTNLAAGSHTLITDIPNRGAMRLVEIFNDGVRTNNSGTWAGSPASLATDAGNGFLMDRGHAIVWPGWQGDVAGGGGRLVATLPVATDANGAVITGITREEFVDTGNAANGTIPATFVVPITYAANQWGTGNITATLTVRQNEKDVRVPIPYSTSLTPGQNGGWQFGSNKQVVIVRPTVMQGGVRKFDSGALYEFIYEAKNPTVMAIGFAAVRDAVSYLRYNVADDFGNANPLAPGGVPWVNRSLAFGVSQAGRVLRDFLYLGFNEDEAHASVFDGMIPHIAGGRKTYTNYRWAQPSRFTRQHEDHLFPQDQFPYSYAKSHDHITGQNDGIMERCQASNTCPKVFHTDSESELWQARASLVVTNTKGHPIPLPQQTVRAFMFSGTQHVPAATPTLGISAHPSNALPYNAHLRALWVAMEEWTGQGITPPDSRYPTVQHHEVDDETWDTFRQNPNNNGTVLADWIHAFREQFGPGWRNMVWTGLAPAEELDFPMIPPTVVGVGREGVGYNAVYAEAPYKDFSTEPPTEGALYPILVASVDSDGNARGGLRHPFLEVPTATHSGWNIRMVGQAYGNLANGSPSFANVSTPVGTFSSPTANTAPQGLQIPFARTAADRATTNDPRLSLQERYVDHADYVAKVTAAAEALRDARLLLQSDVNTIVNAANAAAVP